MAFVLNPFTGELDEVNTGVPGPPGPTGTQGSIGPPGEEGPPGEDGSPGPQGPQGPAGATGATGAVGAQGAPGFPGLDGLDAEEPLLVPGPIGLIGSTGPAGATGPAVFLELDVPEPEPPVPGPQGVQGPIGVQGSAGPAVFLEVDPIEPDPPLPGPQGALGPTGSAGPTGNLFLSSYDVDNDAVEAMTILPDLSQYFYLPGRAGGQVANGGLATSDNLDLAAYNGAFMVGNTGRIRPFDRLQFAIPAMTVNAGFNLIITGPNPTNTTVDTVTAAGGAYEILTQTREIVYNVGPFAGAAPLFMSWPSNVRVKTTSEIDGGPTYRMGANWIADGVAAVVRDSTGIGVFGSFLDNRTFDAANAGTYAATCDAVGFSAHSSAVVAFPQYIGFIFRPQNQTHFTNLIGLDLPATSATTINLGVRNASSTAYTPSANQSFAANGTITVNATALQITATAASLTLTLSTTNAQNGQWVTVINIGTTNAFTLAALASGNVSVAAKAAVRVVFNTTLNSWTIA